jgi:hypothetical protein
VAPRIAGPDFKFDDYKYKSPFFAGIVEDGPQSALLTNALTPRADAYLFIDDALALRRVGGEAATPTKSKNLTYRISTHSSGSARGRHPLEDQQIQALDAYNVP